MRSRSGLVGLRVRALLGDDPVEAVPARDAHARGRGERRPGDQRAQLDELLGRDVDGAQRRARADELDVAAHPHRLSPGAQDLARCGLDADEPEEALLPLVAPDLEVDVDDVVVRDRDLAERVRDRERARLVARVEVPDDPHRVAAPLDAERARPAGLEARLVPAGERRASFHDDRVHERLALAQRDVAVAEGEVARERDLEALAHAERAVGLDVDGDVGLEQAEAVGARGAGKAKGDRRAATSDDNAMRSRYARGREADAFRDLRASGKSAPADFRSCALKNRRPAVPVALLPRLRRTRGS